MVADSDVLVSMRGVCKHYPLFTMDNFNLTLPRGQVLGMVGPNGAGKSTLLKMMMGLVSADAGEIAVLGYKVPEQEVVLKHYAAYVSEDMRLFADYSIRWHMELVAQCFTSTWDASYAKHILHKFELNPEQKIGHLSLGQRVKATLLLAMARRPKLLVLDEPSTGLDPVARHELTSELFELMLNEDNGVIFSSQFTQDVERLSDNIAFIDNGEMISCLDKETYLDQWRRIQLTGGDRAQLPGDLYVTASAGGRVTAIDHAFSAKRTAQLSEAGFEVVQTQPLTLEEIFIQQVLMRRQARGVQR
ncbi:ABC transporter ATP-binding protein [Gilvimarinus sp. SDUM040013]|uniref:ABC transporter ATP-binding protein n=1 Tax=Gilvimarinus gilvus TaxID=3058038 RepID=A0ABU4RUF4_9GAMM|nr:ABC transporter ATP-binding protein [Gilvimarinus sp. SDUM040013]MDO3388237.1 ABC transporter ATP-binding protein [Gilvimarinus sp. SDUM040013]MDX6847787.1 ABC transporter ATP-binding protein [Gilvimarinus sp. SDUM040013]